MAVLNEADRLELFANFMKALSHDRDTLALSKVELRAAVDALDSFLSTNAAAINAAIPQPARGVMTTPQKARLLQFVIQQRYIKGA